MNRQNHQIWSVFSWKFPGLQYLLASSVLISRYSLSSLLLWRNFIEIMPWGSVAKAICSVKSCMKIIMQQEQPDDHHETHTTTTRFCSRRLHRKAHTTESLQLNMCLLGGDCLTSCIVYKTTVHIENGSTSDDRHSIGLTVKHSKKGLQAITQASGARDTPTPRGFQSMYGSWRRMARSTVSIGRFYGKRLHTLARRSGAISASRRKHRNGWPEAPLKQKVRTSINMLPLPGVSSFAILQY